MAHTLTYSTSNYRFTIKVNGNAVGSPYQLTNGDVITLEGESYAWDSGTPLGDQYTSWNVSANGTSIGNQTLSLSGDINIVAEEITGNDTSPQPFSATINYTESTTPTLTFKHFYDAGTIGTGTIKFRHYSQSEPSSGGVVTLSVLNFDDVSKVSGDFVGTLTVSTANNNGNKIQCGAKGYEWLPKFEDDGNVDTIVAEICTAFGVTQDSEGNTIDTSKWKPVTGFWVRVTNNGLDGGSCILTFNYANALSEVQTSDVRLLVYNADLDTLQIDTVASIEQTNGVITTKYAYGFNQVICVILGNETVQAETYQFNEELTSAYSSFVDQELNFTSNSQSCYAIGLDAEDTGSPIDTIRYGIEAETDFIEVYHSNGGWTNASYKTIIIDTSQTVTKGFYTWFTANTTKLS